MKRTHVRTDLRHTNRASAGFPWQTPGFDRWAEVRPASSTTDDPKDDMVLEVAVTSGSAAIVTFNRDDFAGCERFGLRLLSAVELLRENGALT